MKEKGMGRTRLGRLAAVTVPATVVSLGFGYAMLQGMVSAQLSAAEPFQVTGQSANATGLEVSLRSVTTATSNDNGAETEKKSALVTLKNGNLNDLCLAANQQVPLLGTIGLNLTANGNVNLGAITDMSADDVAAASATLPSTEIGVAQNQLDHQAGVAKGYAPGGWGLESTGAVQLNDLDAKTYALSLGGLDLSSGLRILPKLGSATC